MSDFDEDTRTGLRVLVDSLWRQHRGIPALHLPLALAQHGSSLEAVAQALDDLVTEEDDCPECPAGKVESVGRMEWDTGHQPYACTARCGFGG